jgi:tRNA (guanine37-N1)-methyltransferase
MLIDVVTIFPEMFSPVLGESIIKRAREKGMVEIKVHDLRDYSDDPHKRVDSPSYGGGGMVFGAPAFFSACEGILGKKIYPEKEKDPLSRIILMSPRGKYLNQAMVRRFLKYERLLLLAPRYEGVDERVSEVLVDEEISIGDYILSGGELAAMVFIDCLVRLIPGVVSDVESIKNESFEKNSLDFPHYTKPADFKGLRVPEVLLSGNHKEIEKWRREKAREVTQRLRPDLLNEL